MAMDNDDVVSVLNNLIETCEDGVKGFREAAEAVGSPRAKEVFDTRIEYIERAESDLKAAVRRLGGDPEDRGSAAGALHRGWINLKAAITGKNDEAIIAECERGENAAVERYEKALDNDLPTDIRLLVDKQYRGTLQNRDRIRELHRNFASGSTSRSTARDREIPPPV
jgi:uncharacterized protein (TIGR02284 family)